jgi:ParB-like chromosome segregation protein Spo0J
MNEQLKSTIEKAFSEAPDKFAFLNELRTFIYGLSPQKENPVDRVLWVPAEEVVANNYNPNAVASKEMKLLYTSVKEDGYTMPIVTIRDEQLGKYVIVDGFHRNMILRKYQDIAERCHGRLPIVVIEKDIDQRMASTVRHNRARGTHSVDGMVNIVFSMMRDGKSERYICEKLGMEAKEFNKFKYITGFAKIFKNYEYSKAVEKVVSVGQLKESAKKQEEQNNENTEG